MSNTISSTDVEEQPEDAVPFRLPNGGSPLTSAAQGQVSAKDVSIGQPDLTFVWETYFSIREGVARANELFTVQWHIVNVGTVATGQFTALFYTQNTNNFEPVTVTYAYVEMPSLLPGQDTTYAYTHPPLPDGHYMFNAVLGWNGYTYQLNEPTWNNWFQHPTQI